MFREAMCPSSGEITLCMRHFVFVWMTGLQSSHPHRVTNTKFWINRVISPDDGHSRPKHVGKRNEHAKKFVHKFGFMYKFIQGRTVNKT